MAVAARLVHIPPYDATVIAIREGFGNQVLQPLVGK